MTSDRDRLPPAFAELAAYGVCAREAVSSVEELLADLWSRRPHALGSYACRLAADERCFTPAGMLRTPLRLRVGEDVRVPLEVVLERAGLEVAREDPLLLTVHAS
jgi:hypothetical protein